MIEIYKCANLSLMSSSEISDQDSSSSSISGDGKYFLFGMSTQGTDRNTSNVLFYLKCFKNAILLLLDV